MLSRLKKRIAYLKSAIALRKTPYNVDVLLHGSHVAIYPKLNICFNRIKKSGNTSISAFLEELSNNFEKEIDKGFKSSLVKPKNMKPSDLSSLSTYYSFVVVR
ncbi:sulfotransferase family 2 domain-containing protein, partial [Roseinatronobacter sp.]|uniref:sulfotransferase family 2 domain-containing protein n=1 Tax=Roseinatronobacter sp. TaxID=1945755 RepID=UPI0025F7A8A5